jgi:hypothetical protein
VRPEDLLTRAPSAEVVARETQKLPQPSEEAREALRRSLEAAARPPASAPWPALLQEARGKMDSRYAEPATSHRGGLAGLALVVSKRVFRRVFQPFINEALRKQVEFNESILDALATIHDVQREHARTQATWRQELEHRLSRIEAAAERAAARGRDDAPQPVEPTSSGSGHSAHAGRQVTKPGRAKALSVSAEREAAEPRSSEPATLNARHAPSAAVTATPGSTAPTPGASVSGKRPPPAASSPGEGTQPIPAGQPRGGSRGRSRRR